MENFRDKNSTSTEKSGSILDNIINVSKNTSLNGVVLDKIGDSFTSVYNLATIILRGVEKNSDIENNEINVFDNNFNLNLNNGNSAVAFYTEIANASETGINEVNFYNNKININTSQELADGTTQNVNIGNVYGIFLKTDDDIAQNLFGMVERNSIEIKDSETNSIDSLGNVYGIYTKTNVDIGNTNDALDDRINGNNIVLNIINSNSKLNGSLYGVYSEGNGSIRGNGVSIESLSSNNKFNGDIYGVYGGGTEEINENYIDIIAKNDVIIDGTGKMVAAYSREDGVMKEII